MPSEQIRVLNDEESKDAEPTESETDDVFLRKIEATLLTQVRPRVVLLLRTDSLQCLHTAIQHADYGRDAGFAFLAALCAGHTVSERCACVTGGTARRARHQEGVHPRDQDHAAGCRGGRGLPEREHLGAGHRGDQPPGCELLPSVPCLSTPFQYVEPRCNVMLGLWRAVMSSGAQAGCACR